MKVFVGIPALNEERTIANIVAGSRRQSNNVLVVDDGSDDDTGASVLRHKKNLVYGASVRDCFDRARQSRADVLITIDADGQHDPSDILMPVNALVDNKADVIASRASRPSGMPRYRWGWKTVLDRATKVRAGDKIPDTQGGFRA